MASLDDVDKAWERLGKVDPYYGVVTHDVHRVEREDNASRRVFFQSGHDHIAAIMQVVHEHFGATFAPARALDFGCGVGRLVIPLAARAAHVTGVDISSAMLDEARRNCEQQQVKNVAFVKSDDDLSGLTGTFDFVHSFIVFQHIPPRRGERVARRLIDLLNEGGVGVLHFTYRRNTTWPKRFVYWARARIPFVNAVIDLARVRALGHPWMQMNEYDVGALLRMLQQRGCHECHLRFTAHENAGTTVDGVVLFFRKRPLPLL